MRLELGKEGEEEEELIEEVEGVSGFARNSARRRAWRSATVMSGGRLKTGREMRL